MTRILITSSTSTGGVIVTPSASGAYPSGMTFTNSITISPASTTITSTTTTTTGRANIMKDWDATFYEHTIRWTRSNAVVYQWTAPVWTDDDCGHRNCRGHGDEWADAIDAIRERDERMIAAHIARHPYRAPEVDGAARRAETLLRRELTPEQIEDLEKKNFFFVRGKNRVYRIDRGTHGNVRLLGDDGDVLGSYCIQPNGVPEADAMLAQKFWIEHNEAEFLQVANYRAQR